MNYLEMIKKLSQDIKNDDLQSCRGSYKLKFHNIHELDQLKNKAKGYILEFEKPILKRDILDEFEVEAWKIDRFTGYYDLYQRPIFENEVVWVEDSLGIVLMDEHGKVELLSYQMSTLDQLEYSVFGGIKHLDPQRFESLKVSILSYVDKKKKLFC